MSVDMGLRHTPLYLVHLALGAKMVPFAGWEMPIQYGGIVAEHRAVRGAAGLFDLSHMGEFFFEGAGALSAIIAMRLRRIRASACSSSSRAVGIRVILARQSLCVRNS